MDFICYSVTLIETVVDNMSQSLILCLIIVQIGRIKIGCVFSATLNGENLILLYDLLLLISVQKELFKDLIEIKSVQGVGGLLFGNQLCQNPC